MAHKIEWDLAHVIWQTPTVWSHLAGSNIFITGGSGFVGSWLLESFVWANEHRNLNARLTVLTRDAAAFAAKRPHLAAKPSLEIVCGDLKTVRFPDTEFQYVIHTATEHEDPMADIEGTRRVLEMARTHGTRRLLFTSSGAVYGEQPPDIDKVDESYCAAELSLPYAKAKRASEELCNAASDSQMKVIIARLFAFVGPYLPLNLNFAVGNFIRDARLGGPINIEGDGTSIRSYLYGADLAIWLWTLVVQGDSTAPYNVGSDQAVSILELAKLVERLCCPGKGIVIAKTAVPGQKPNRYIPSIERARTQFGLYPLIGLEEGITRMFNFP